MYQWYEEPVEERWDRRIVFDQCRLREFWPHVGIPTVSTV